MLQSYKKRMGFVEDFKKELIYSDLHSFEEKALLLFNYQSKCNSLYQSFVSALGKRTSHIKRTEEIPFLPISFFKTHKIVSADRSYPSFFESSGTTGNITSKLYHYDLPFYWQNTMKIFEHFFGELKGYSFFFLLPNYLERQHSSLVSMANFFWENSDRTFGGFFLYDFEKVKDELIKALHAKRGKVILWGVTFALLDFADQYGQNYEDLILFETGGMKGRGREPLKEEVHLVLREKLGVSRIHSEYGMTELFSQAYSQDSTIFSPASTMNIFIREPEDPLSVHSRVGERGGINVVDLANVDTCAFIETQDLGMLHSTGFEVLGRFDNSDIRGCNLMVH